MEHTPPRRDPALRPRRSSYQPRTATRAAIRQTRTPARPTRMPTRRRAGSRGGRLSRMPGIQTPRTAEIAQMAMAMTATSRSCASMRSAACRRSSARSSSSARRRSASICGAFHLQADAVAVERFFERRHDHAGEPGFHRARAGCGPRPGQAFGGALPEFPRDVDEASHRVGHGCPLCDAHWLSLKRECRGRKPGRGFAQICPGSGTF